MNIFQKIKDKSKKIKVKSRAIGSASGLALPKQQLEGEGGARSEFKQINSPLEGGRGMLLSTF
jgi:hypothetical protein